MTTTGTIWVALLRGINIGPKKRISMADLRALVERLGYTDVRTLVNSGNVVFRAARSDEDEATVAARILAALRADHELDVPVVVRSGAELREVVAANPFPEAAGSPKELHVTFLDREPAPERVAALAEAERGDDDYRVIGRHVYLHYPHKTSGATFFPTGLDKALGVETTSRNWNTVTTLAEMASDEA